MSATAVGNRFGFVGVVDADSIFARRVWMKTSGGCPVMRLPGSVRTVAARTGSEISS